MASKHTSSEPPKNKDTSDGKDTSDAGETNTTFHGDNFTFHFCGPQFIVNSKGNALNVEVDSHGHEDKQKESVISSSVTVRPFHGGDTQRWLIHDDGCGGIAIMSLYTKKYVATNTNREFSCRDAPYFWDISKDGKGYSLGTKHLGYILCLCLMNSQVKLVDPQETGYGPIFILQSTPENHVAIRRSQFMTSSGTTVQLADAHIHTSSSIPAFPELPLGLPSHQIIDTVTAGRECTGFPTGFFRIRASGSSLYWSLCNQDSSEDGNSLFLSDIKCKKDTQVFYINAKGELCLSGGYVDVCENALILARNRAPTVPWPNPWSHPMPTFSYSEETRCISVKFYVDPCVSRRWPRAEREWKEKEFIVAAQCTKDVRTPSFDKVSRWAPTQRFVMWQHHNHIWDAQGRNTVGIEEQSPLINPGKGTPNRFRWELEEV